MTINGSDAPDGGVTIRGATLIIDASQVIVRHIRVRPGPGGPDPGNGDAITIKISADHVVLDHCSLSWGTDEVLTIYGRDVTVQWSFITEGLNCAGHPRGCHSRGLMFPEPATRFSVLHTLVAHHADRNPFVRSGLTEVPNQYQLVNSVFYNYGEPTLIETLAPTGTIEFDFIGNFYKRGVNNTNVAAIRLASRRLAAFKGSLSLYLDGNISPQRPGNAAAQDLLLPEERRGYVSGRRHFPALASETDAFAAFERVLSSAGATLPCRDAVDRRVASDVRARAEPLDRPPTNAVVLSLDEKIQVQALSRTHPLLSLRPGLPARQTHDYRRNGVTSLYAALEVAPGRVVGACRPTHTGADFLAFLKRLARLYRGRALHGIVDNSSTRSTPAAQAWLAAHPRIQLHFTPTGASWLNLVEAWFSILTRKSVRRGSFDTVPALIRHIEHYIAHWNEHPTLVWTKEPTDVIKKGIRQQVR